MKRQPAEWAPHAAIWTAWPSDASLWEENLEPAQAEVAAMVAAIVADGGEPVELLVDGAEAEATARLALADHPSVRIHRCKFGDIWLRDTGPLFLSDGSAAAFRFNGWGGKYALEGDDTVADFVAETQGSPLTRHDWVIEGGAIEPDGTGRVVTTRQCLLNPNRNPSLSQADIEARLAADLGLDTVIWLGDGLLNDHTDGHVDNLARFVAEGVVVVPEPAGADDPNAEVYAEARQTLEAAGLDVRTIPSPGLLDVDGEAIPASYMNFLITNKKVIVPIYGQPNDDAAVAAVQALFPGREAVGLPANNILTGGGSFHCITQQVPAL
ncbi:agmatine deiminase family protein [Sphingosinicella soli]|uniref:Agmatine deiminase n=1 Tax=Sphingosinicella soli TaxID=333708 RepID=A0A7W7B3C3_9SPHN|nr:agmatine deiminase family protein [Sphingosinicella soli]MBB4633196.1 agmatine deiminase [Sphingosinicella soli]